MPFEEHSLPKSPLPEGEDREGEAWSSLPPSRPSPSGRRRVADRLLKMSAAGRLPPPYPLPSPEGRGAWGSSESLNRWGKQFSQIPRIEKNGVSSDASDGIGKGPFCLGELVLSCISKLHYSRLGVQGQPISLTRETFIISVPRAVNNSSMPIPTNTRLRSYLEYLSPLRGCLFRQP